MSQDTGEGFQQVKVCQVRVAEMQRPQKKGTSASKYVKTGLRDTEEGLQRTKYVKAGNSASKYVRVLSGVSVWVRGVGLYAGRCPAPRRGRPPDGLSF